MKVAVALESRFARTPDQAIWSSGWLDRTFWDRYLQVFEEVIVLARVQDVSEPLPQAKRADAKGVSFAALPYYVGPWQYATKYGRLRREVARMMPWDAALILRAPGLISSLVAKVAARRAKPYAVEVVADPAEVFGGAVKSIAAPIARITSTRALRAECAGACAVAYVSSRLLPLRYPPRPGAFVTEYSTIDLRDDAYVDGPREFRQPPTQLRLVCVGSMHQLYKGQDVLIRAVAVAGKLLAQQAASHLPPTLTLIGDGRHRDELAQIAGGAGVSDRVRFLGQLPSREAVRAALDCADVFVLASRTEGLPRAMIEAMARALPCIGTTVGGIPDLLQAQELVRPDDAEALGRKIVELAQDPARLRRLSEVNLQQARAYHASVLGPRRVAMYEIVRDQTATWLQRATPAG